MAPNEFPIKLPSEMSPVKNSDTQEQPVKLAMLSSSRYIGVRHSRQGAWPCDIRLKVGGSTLPGISHGQQVRRHYSSVELVNKSRRNILYARRTVVARLRSKLNVTRPQESRGDLCVVFSENPPTAETNNCETLRDIMVVLAWRGVRRQGTSSHV